MKTSAALVLGFFAFSCKTSEPASTRASSAPEPASSAAPAAPAASTEAPAPAPAAPQAVSPDAPASFEKGQKETIANAIGLGCETKSLDGWLELLCRRKNGTGGHPARALVRDPLAESVAAPAGSANQQQGSELGDAGEADAGLG